METFFMIMAMLNAILPVVQQVEAIVTEPKAGKKKKSMVKTIAASAGGMALDRGASHTQTKEALEVLDEAIDLGVSILNMYAWKGDAGGEAEDDEDPLG